MTMKMADANAPHSYHAPHDGQPLMYIMMNILSICKYVSSFMTALAEFGQISEWRVRRFAMDGVY
jgi:hypothetical protein